MVRKVLKRKELREESDAAQRSAQGGSESSIEIDIASEVRDIGEFDKRGVETLVLVRLRPPPVFDLQITSIVSKDFDGDIEVADDGDEITP